MLVQRFKFLRSGDGGWRIGEKMRKYHVYLFERILLCCKKEKRKRDDVDRKVDLILKGRIYISHLVGVSSVQGGRDGEEDGRGRGRFGLQVLWMGETGEEEFVLWFQVKGW